MTQNLHHKEGHSAKLALLHFTKIINKYFIDPLGEIQISISQQPTNPHIQNEIRQKIHKIQYGQYPKAINTVKKTRINY